MCDYCGCRTMQVIDKLGAEHDDLLAMAGDVRPAIEGGRPADARRRLDELPSAWDEAQAAADGVRRRAG